MLGQKEASSMNAYAIKHLSIIGIALVLFAGCEPKGPVTTQGVLTRTAVNPPLPPPPPGTPAAEAEQKVNPFDRGGPAAAESTNSQTAAASPSSTGESTFTPPEPSASTSKPSLRLSVGIALPQTLPDGTQVGVSVDYKLISGSLNSSAKYVWVIESRQGQTAMEVKLSPRGGNLAGYLPLSIRPEDSPFKAWIDEVSTSGSRVRVSNVESLR
jgi:hypothetical protein